MIHFLYDNKETTLEAIDLSSVKGVLVDFDNTLYEYTPCHKKALQASWESFKALHEVSYEEFEVLYAQAQKVVKSRLKKTASEHSRLLYFQVMLENVFGCTKVEESLHLEEVYWDTFFRGIVLHEEILYFLTKAKNNTIKICLVTDLTANVQLRKMVASGLCSYVDYVVTSEEAGREKPESDIFHLALAKLGLQKGEVIMIGDDRIKDIQGAEACAIRAYQVIHT